MRYLSLNGSDNTIGDEGATWLALALKSNADVRVMDVAWNGVRSSAASLRQQCSENQT